MTKKNGMTMTDVVEMFCSDMHELQERLQMDEVDVLLSLPQTVSTDYPSIDPLEAFEGRQALLGQLVGHTGRHTS